MIKVVIAPTNPDLQFLTCCAWCQRIRTPLEKWEKPTVKYLDENNFNRTHTICPTCMQQIAQSLPES